MNMIHMPPDTKLSTYSRQTIRNMLEAQRWSRGAHLDDLALINRKIDELTDELAKRGTESVSDRYKAAVPERY
jgi:hypothetical protein